MVGEKRIFRKLENIIEVGGGDFVQNGLIQRDASRTGRHRYKVVDINSS